MESLTKQKNRFNLYDICFMISALAGFGILIAMPHKETSIMSLGTYTIAICTVIMYVKRCSNYINRMLPEDLALLLLVIICIMALLFSPSDFRNSFVKLICFLEIPIFMLCGKEINSKRTAQLFLWLQYGLSFYYMYLSQTDKAYLYEGEYGIIELEELTLSYHNPNEASMYLTACFVTLLIAFITYKKVIIKLLFSINAAYVFHLVWLTACRAGMVVCTLSVLAFVFIKVISVKHFITRIALAIPLVMIILIYFYNDQLTEWQFLGSSFETSRINVFEQVFSGLEFHEIFVGDFATHSFDNLHNLYVSVFGTIGIFGVVFYALFIDNILTTQCNNSSYILSQKMSYIGVLLIIVYSSVEATIFVGGSAFAMGFMSVFVFFAFNYEKTE